MKVLLGLPKGSLQEMTVSMMNRAGFGLRYEQGSYQVELSDPGIKAVFIRAQEIPRYVNDGSLDAGISGEDWVAENKAKVKVVSELGYSRASFKPIRWVLAVPEGSSIKSVKDLKGKRVATELVGVTKSFLKRQGVSAKVEFSWGATEVKAPRFVDAIVEATETGASLRANRLRQVETIMESRSILFANRDSWKDKVKREKISKVSVLLKGVVDAIGKVGLKMNVEEKDVSNILKILPALQKPTISSLSDGKWFAIETIIEEKEVHRLLPRLKSGGAHGIVEYPLSKIIY